MKIECGLLLDLSLRRTGWAVVRDEPLRYIPETMQYTPSWFAWGEIPLTDAKLSQQERVGTLGVRLDALLLQYEPRWVAAEMPAHAFSARGGKSVSSAASVQMQQRAFGAAYLLTWLRGVPFIDVDPSLSKFALTGKSRADKQTVAWCLAGHFGYMVADTGKPLWPKGITEAVRDALAVSVYVDKLRAEHGPAWLDVTLAHQGKPTADLWLSYLSHINAPLS